MTTDTVRVTAAAVPFKLKEFEERRQKGIGRFLGPEKLEGMRDQRITDVIPRSFSGLRAVVGQNGTTAAKSMDCDVDVYVDGFRISDSSDRDYAPLDNVKTDELLAIEYFSKYAAPPRYRRPGTSCAVLLLWRK